MDTPVAMLVFNRPEVTQRVFDRIRAVKPRKLLVVADGPRPHRDGESERCDRTRDIFNRIDWQCDVATNFASTNMGCRERIASGLTWIFEHVAEAIILEDDCLPDPTFFRYCEELLDRYRDDTRIMGISGDHFLSSRPRTTDSYYFSRYMHVWGWASWKRAWQHYDKTIRLWPELRNGGWLNDILADRRAITYWTRIYQDVYDGRIDTWDYQWQLAVWLQNGLVVLPNQNLISNIGFAGDATHTEQPNAMANLPTTPLAFPLRHPRWIVRDTLADSQTQNSIYSPGYLRRIERRLKIKN